MQCLVGKVQQQAMALKYAGANLSMDDGDILNRSVAVHKLDCANLQANVHFASHANHIATSYGLKTKKVFREHKVLHQTANVAKHEHFGGEAFYNSAHFDPFQHHLSTTTTTTSTSTAAATHT